MTPQNMFVIVLKKEKEIFKICMLRDGNIKRIEDNSVSVNGHTKIRMPIR